MASPEPVPPLTPWAAPASEAPEVDLAFQVDCGPLGREAAMAGAQDLVSGQEAEALWCELMRQWLEALMPELPPSLRASAYSLGLSLVDDTTMAVFNQTWRQQSGATDVLAFAAQDDALPLPPAPGGHSTPVPLELGDIVISLETAGRQATEAGQSLTQELLFLATHGLLHLLGWDHPDGASLATMLAKQDDLVSHTGHRLDVTPGLCDGESPG